MEKKHFITQKGLDKLKKELEELKTVKRKEIATRIQEAKELGDLSENAEYVEAKNEQAFVEGRILELENMIKNAQIIDEVNHSKNVVGVGSKIKVRSGNEVLVYNIVGSNEADPSDGKISNESPLGQAFLQKRVGDKVEIKLPKGSREFTILKIF